MPSKTGARMAASPTSPPVAPGPGKKASRGQTPEDIVKQLRAELKFVHRQRRLLKEIAAETKKGTDKRLQASLDKLRKILNSGGMRGFDKAVDAIRKNFAERRASVAKIARCRQQLRRLGCLCD